MIVLPINQAQTKPKHPINYFIKVYSIGINQASHVFLFGN